MIEGPGDPTFVMEYIRLGSLYQEHERESILPEEAKVVLFQTLQALSYLHDQMQLTHRDIKPENILVKSRKPKIYIKLCDFGLSAEQTHMTSFLGTYCYAAPEIGKGAYSSAVDIWAIGMVTLQYGRSAGMGQRIHAARVVLVYRG